MPYVLVIIGLLMVVTGARGTYVPFGRQVASDFTGPNNFTYWVVGIGAVGALGYIDALRTFSRLFMTLVVLVLLLHNKGFFAQFSAALKTGPIAPTLPQNSTASFLGSTVGTAAANNSDVQAQQNANNPPAGGLSLPDFLGRLFGPSPAY